MTRFYLTTLALVLNVLASAFFIVALYDYGFGYVFAAGLCISLSFVALSSSSLLRIADELDRQALEIASSDELTPIQVRLDKSWMNQA